MNNFFSSLNPITSFLHFTNNDFYTQVPSDWLIVITDVEGSTKAIEAGKYKWVNMSGASSIVAIVNAIGDKNFPFVFGGDGATAIIPPDKKVEVEKYLRSARNNAQEAFGLNLRIGIISHQDLINKGATVKVARYGMPNGPSIAFFRGEGLTVAEKLVKSGTGIIGDGMSVDSGKALQGLSCRWAPLKNIRGVMLSIIVKPRMSGEQGEATLLKITQQIDSIVDLENPQTHPVKDETFQSEKMLKAATAEANLLAIYPRWLGILKVIVEMNLVKILDRFHIKLPGLNFCKYKHSMIAHSDYRKYDEQLRMVIDSTIPMKNKIREYLEEQKNNGSIYFGLYESDSALMTCFLQSFDEGGHIHFIDGSDGGYALAAKEMKLQMKEKEKEKEK